MKKFILFAAAAAMFAACANENDLALTQQQAANETDANLISFDAYLQRAVTRAGYQGDLTTSSLQNAEAGFGVFGYYTDNFDYTPTSVPNFMYNEKVTYSGGTWSYDVPKYWPNEYGSMANSADQDRVSFFAYAPYIYVDPSTGFPADPSTGNIYDASSVERQTGITGMKRNSLSGDPVVYYVGSFDQSTSVDLCWGVVGTATNWQTNGTTQSFTAGFPWLNVRRPDALTPNDDARVKFTFKHALAKLIVNVQTNFDDGWKNTNTGANTKVWIRSIRFTGIAEKAALNLNNPTKLGANKARWIDYYGTNELEMGESVTVCDGRKDGSEGLSGAVAANEAVTGLNPQLIQDEKQLNSNAWITLPSEDVRTGVTSSSVNMFANGNNPADYVYVIPTGERVDVEICYDVETIDPKLPSLLSDGATPGSTIENRISKTNVFASGDFVSGKTYTLNLLLGMKDVQFTAEVTSDWDTGGTQEVHLPYNMPAFAAYTGDGHITASTSSASTTYKFAVTGLNPDEAVTCDKDGAIVTAVTSNSTSETGTDSKANSSGVTYVTATVTSKEIFDKTTNGAITISGTSGKKVIIDLCQRHVPLGLGVPGSTTSSATYTFTSTGITTASNWQVASSSSVPPTVKCWVAGTELEYTTGDIAEGKFKFNEGVLTLNAAPGGGKIIKLTVKTGDADEETVEFTTTE